MTAKIKSLPEEAAVPTIKRRSSIHLRTHVKLLSLKGNLQKYNGEIVPVRPMADGSNKWLIDIGDGFQLVMEEPQLMKISEDCDDKAKKNKAFRENFKRNEMSGANRSNVKFAMEAVGSEVRRQLHLLAKQRAKKKNKDWQQALFTEFDRDGNGTIEKSEFVNFLAGLGVTMSQTDVDLIWPVFDTDSSGGIDYAEFLQIIKPESNPQYHKPEFIMQMERISKSERGKRISNASSKLSKGIEDVGRARSAAEREQWRVTEQLKAKLALQESASPEDDVAPKQPKMPSSPSNQAKSPNKARKFRA